MMLILLRGVRIFDMKDHFQSTSTSRTLFFVCLGIIQWWGMIDFMTRNHGHPVRLLLMFYHSLRWSRR